MVLIVPVTFMPACGAAAAVTLVMIGKFCLRLGPSSASPGSLGVGPSSPRSMPRPPLEKIKFGASVLPTESAATAMPSPPLKAIVLETTKLLSPVTSTPWPALPGPAAAAVGLVPM